MLRSVQGDSMRSPRTGAGQAFPQPRTASAQAALVRNELSNIGRDFVGDVRACQTAWWIGMAAPEFRLTEALQV